jgi:hypothetical protein
VVAGRVNAGVNGFNAIEDGGGFKRGIKGGKMRRGGNGLVAPEARSGAELTAGARLTERRGKGGQLRRRKPKGKTYNREDATNAWARWAGRGSVGLRGQRGQLAGWLGQRPSGPQGRPGRK